MKKLFTIALCLTAALTLSAQQVAQSSFDTNWYLDVSAGAQMYVGNDVQGNRADAVKPAFNVEVGNWVNPYVSLGAKFDLVLADQTTGYLAVAVASFDVTNIILGYNNDKKFHVLLPISIGGSIAKHPDVKGCDSEYIAGYGLKASYDLSSNIALVAGVNNYIARPAYDTVVGGPYLEDMVPSATIGLRFNISSADSKLKGKYISGRTYKTVRNAKNVKYGCPKGSACCGDCE